MLTDSRLHASRMASFYGEDFSLKQRKSFMSGQMDEKTSVR